MNRDKASALKNDFGIDTARDFHALPSEQVHRILDAAKAAKYRTPKNANGSRARMFHAALCRALNRKG